MRQQIGALPPKQGLYDPQYEHDACGIGFVVDIKGKKSHRIVEQALTILLNLEHRGGVGAEVNTGDGAGIITQIPDAFFRRESAVLDLPQPGEYAVGMVFLPNDTARRATFEENFERIVEQEGQRILGWRTVPTVPDSLGETARASLPHIRQIFIGRGREVKDALAFERKLYVIRRRAEQAIRYAGRREGERFYVASLSARTIVYKGMLTAGQVTRFYPDLGAADFESALALVHSRYSTNTFPTWDRAHPYRYLVHNGEINTLRGNVNWMHARQSTLASELFGPDLVKTMPVLNPDGSDSAIFDNCLEFLVLTGRSLPHAMMMMIPEPWARNESMSPEKKAFYEYHACLMEPWDGPAAMAFTDGATVGAVLDRNGLRPSRYYVTKDDQVIMASEVGVIEIPPERVLRKGRLEPGRMFLVDTAAGRIIADEELKQQIATAYPYRQWLDQHLVRLEDLPAAPAPAPADGATLRQRQKAFGYSYEDLRLILAPMAKDAIEPVGSMGNDAPLAVLSEKPQLLYDYFKQLFAQVTNPPLDALREEIVTATETMIGSEGRLLEPSPESCRQIKLASPILSNAEMAKIKALNRPGFKPAILPMLFAPGQGGLEKALSELYAQADAEIDRGANLLILCDRGIAAGRAAIPALLAVSGLHHHLIRRCTRTQVSLVLESGEPRETHHFALLLGYGASAINPYLALESIADMVSRGLVAGVDVKKASANYVKAGTKGVLKILSKMGISTIQGYQGAQIFEAVGLGQDLIDRYFTWTPSRVGGIGLELLTRETLARHQRAYQLRPEGGDALESAGQYQWRRQGEYHLYNPETIHRLQTACRSNDYDLYREYVASLAHPRRSPVTLRDLLEFTTDREPVPLSEVEPVDSIVRRFKTGAMSFGSISQEAHECLAIAMNRLGARSNSGEGGEDPARYVRDVNGDARWSAIKQVASGRFGVTSEYLSQAQEIQIKIAQGAKPGEGGQLPGRKVYPWVAKVRHATPGVGLISPPPHHDIYSIEDLAQLIHDLKHANPRARISVKLVSEVGVGTIAAGVAKGRADIILISGYDGGTGASPRNSIRHAGLPWELGLAETHQTLILNNLRSRVVLETDGKLMTGRDVVVAALLGAEEYGFATAPLVVMGCVMMRFCNLDTCPVGVATQNPALRKNFAGDPEHVINFMRFIAQDAREIMARLGFRTFDEMIGHTERLVQRRESVHAKAAALDLSSILHQVQAGPEVGRRWQIPQNHALEESLDCRTLQAICRPAIEEKQPVRAILPIRNTDRATGAIIGNAITNKYGAAGLPEDAIRLHFKGSAGQSFGAFTPPGMTLLLEGDANDYFGKGLSGGRLAVYPPEAATFPAEENVIIGNVALYGATGGEAYVRGTAGERFAVRNSGAQAVVEAVGDHGCEYMTGGRVVVLGATGRNFAAGMSGGIAYVFDAKGDFKARCNQEMVGLARIEEGEEAQAVKSMIERHAQLTGSPVAAKILSQWEVARKKFVKVIPHDYQRVMTVLQRVQSSGLSGEEAILAAFAENKEDLSRVSGS